MLLFRYISFHYIKYFLLILFALSLFFVGFDYISNASKLPSSVNLILIYLVYKTFFAIDMLLPISLVFGMIMTKVYLIKTNSLISFYSLGYSRKDVLKPFIYLSSLIILIFILLHSSVKFAKSSEFSDNIMKNSEYLSPTRDLFFIYNNKFVYFKELISIKRKAYGIRVFIPKNNSLKQVITAKSAIYLDDNFWHIKDAKIITKPDSLTFDAKGIKVEEKKDIKILKDFRPKILDQVYEGSSSYTLLDAIDALRILSKENIKTDKIRYALYKILIHPLFAPFLVIIIFFFVPISPRFLNISLFSFIAILSTLLIWGVLFILMELSKNKTLPAEAGIIAPIVILFFIAVYKLRGIYE